jgi:hypothetical protein
MALVKADLFKIGDSLGKLECFREIMESVVLCGTASVV